jgi:hypothetical protein
MGARRSHLDLAPGNPGVPVDRIDRDAKRIGRIKGGERDVRCLRIEP